MQISLLPFRHLSLDLWLTLIRSAPAYKPARNRLFAAHFGIDRTAEETDAVFRQYDLHFNAVNEQTGGSVTVWEMYYAILAALGGSVSATPLRQLEDFYAKSEALLAQHPPLLMDAGVPAMLRQLKEAGVTVSLLSNTGFILGRTLRKMMPALGLEGIFDFELYSDEEGMSKPSLRFFDKVAARAVLPGAESRSRIVHVGDNPVADVQGAERSGMHGVLLKNEEETLSSLLDRIFAGRRPDPSSCIPLSQHIP